jgi:hypothetical protein
MHFEHADCEAHGQRAPVEIAAFIIRLDPGIQIPMEQTLITGCALCAILRKVMPYLPKGPVDDSLQTFEFQLETSGIKRTLFIECGHGLIAHRLLLEWLQSVEEADVVVMRFHL